MTSPIRVTLAAATLSALSVLAACGQGEDSVPVQAPRPAVESPDAPEPQPAPSPTLRYRPDPGVERCSITNVCAR